MIGYDAEILRLLLAQYDAGLRPMQPVALLLALAATWLALRPPARAQGWSPRAVAAVLALAWAWIGYGWFWSVMAGLDFFAPVPAALFAVQGLLLGWTGALRGRLALRARPDAAGGAGLALIGTAIVLHPLLAGLMGDGWAARPPVLLGATPTAILTLGLLLLAVPRPPWHLLAIPLAWCGFAGFLAIRLGMVEDLLAPAAGLVALVAATMATRQGRAQRA